MPLQNRLAANAAKVISNQDEILVTTNLRIEGMHVKKHPMASKFCCFYFYDTFV